MQADQPVEMVASFQEVWKHYRSVHVKGRFLKDFVARASAEMPPKFVALRSVSFDLPRGQALGVIGENGSGKSSTLRLLAGTSQPSRGSVTVSGRVSTLLELGTGFHPEFTGIENIFLNGALLGIPRQRIRQRLGDIIAFADLGDFINQPVKTYSSGMYMRLGFAIAVNVEADLLLIDEVLAVGDEYFQHKCYQKIFEFRQLGKTIVFVSHDLSSVEKLCDRCIWLDHGQVMADGKPSAVIDQYRRYVSERERGESKPVEAQDADRWGNQDVVFTAVEMVDAEGRATRQPRTGDDLTLLMEIAANREVSAPICGISFFSQEDIRCYGTNTLVDGLRMGHLSPGRKVRLDLSLPEFALLPGRYYLSIALHGEDNTAYDFWSKAIQLEVHSQGSDLGLVRLRHEWSIVEQQVAESATATEH